MKEKQSRKIRESKWKGSPILLDLSFVSFFPCSDCSSSTVEDGVGNYNKQCDAFFETDDVDNALNNTTLESFPSHRSVITKKELDKEKDDKDGKCVKSAKIEGEDVFDYITAEDLDEDKDDKHQKDVKDEKLSHSKQRT